MRRMRIYFIDDHGKETNDYLNGWPVVDVNISLGFDRNTWKPGDQVIMQPLKALVDTGTNGTMVSEVLGAGVPSVRVGKATNVGIVRDSRTLNACVEIVGLDKPYSMEVGCASLEGARVHMIIGRDLLDKYRMVYDPPQRETYLENPNP